MRVKRTLLSYVAWQTRNFSWNLATVTKVMKILSTCYVLLVYSSLSKGKPIKPRNFEHHPRRRGFCSEAKLFNEVKYVHVLRMGEGGGRSSQKIVFCKKKLLRSLIFFCVFKTVYMFQNILTLTQPANLPLIQFLDWSEFWRTLILNF